MKTSPEILWGAWGRSLTFLIGLLLGSNVFGEEKPGWLQFPSGDQVLGDPVKIEGSQWWVQTPYADSSVPSDAPAQIWVSRTTSRQEEGKTLLHLLNGDILTGTLKSWDAKQLIFLPFWGGEVRVPVRLVQDIEFRSDTEEVHLAGPAPISAWRDRQYYSAHQFSQLEKALQVGPALHFKDQVRKNLTSTLQKVPSRFRLSASWSFRKSSEQRHNLNLYQNRTQEANVPNLVFNYYQGKGQITASSRHVRNKEEFPISTNSSFQKLELYMDANTGEWMATVNGVVRQYTPARPTDEETVSTRKYFDRSLRWYSYSKEPMVFESLRIERWESAFPNPEEGSRKIPKGQVGLVLRNGDVLKGPLKGFDGKVFRITAGEIGEIPVSVQVVKQVLVRPSRTTAAPIGEGKYLVSLRD